MNKNAIGLHKFSRIFRRGILQYFPHIPCRLQPKLRGNRRNASTLPSHAPCRLQRPLDPFAGRLALLCLHTLRADCNFSFFSRREMLVPLPPHAPCRLQPAALSPRRRGTSFASTRSVQIATSRAFFSSSTASFFASTRSVQIATIIDAADMREYGALPPHAPCRLQRTRKIRQISLSCFASTRSVQIATAEMHRIAIYTFFERVLSW